jgi:ABC-type dipeptide/oligopeptide/nickel transport system ATPase component
MADVSFNEVDKIYDNGVQAVFDLTLDIHDGEFLVLVGPSGCGKTTALRMVAGLEKISDGTLSIGGRVVNDMSPKERDIAMVFQNYALYPHLSVGENIAFGLRLRKTDKQVINERVAWAGKLLGLTQYLDFVVTHEDYQRSKPHPDAYLTAVAQPGLDPATCIVVEDSERGLTSATAAGLPCLIVLSEWTKDGDFRKARRNDHVRAGNRRRETGREGKWDR